MDCRKNILQAYSNSLKVAEAGEPLTFDNQYFKNGCGMKFVPGAKGITLCAPGIYKVSVHVTAVLNDDPAPIDPEDSLGALSIQLYEGDKPSAPNKASALIAAAIVPITLSFEGLVEVKPSCPYIDNQKTISVVNLNNAISYDLASITVVKIA